MEGYVSKGRRFKESYSDSFESVVTAESLSLRASMSCCCSGGIVMSINIIFLRVL